MIIEEDRISVDDIRSGFYWFIHVLPSLLTLVPVLPGGRIGLPNSFSGKDGFKKTSIL